MTKKRIPIISLWIVTLIITPLIGKIGIDPFHLSPFGSRILLELRIPRTLMAILAGGNLALSGFLLQRILINPLATPYTLGISSGASLGFLAASLSGLSFIAGNFFALIGSLAGVVIAYILSLRHRTSDPNMLILAGIVVNVIFSSVILFLYYISPRGVVIEVLHWTMGNIYPVGYETIATISLVTLVVVALLFFLRREIDISSLGREEAITLGVNYDLIFVTTILAATLLTSLIVSVTGPIGFIGLIAPHIVRGLGIGKAGESMLFNFMTGGILLAWSDCLSRIVLPSSEVPVGIITAFAGGIFLLVILKRTSRSAGWSL